MGRECFQLYFLFLNQALKWCFPSKQEIYLEFPQRQKSKKRMINGHAVLSKCWREFNPDIWTQHVSTFLHLRGWKCAPQMSICFIHTHYTNLKLIILREQVKKSKSLDWKFSPPFMTTLFDKQQLAIALYRQFCLTGHTQCSCIKCYRTGHLYNYVARILIFAVWIKDTFHQQVG